MITIGGTRLFVIGGWFGCRDRVRWILSGVGVCWWLLLFIYFCCCYYFYYFYSLPYYHYYSSSIPNNCLLISLFHSHYFNCSYWLRTIQNVSVEESSYRQCFGQTNLVIILCLLVSYFFYYCFYFYYRSCCSYTVGICVIVRWVIWMMWMKYSMNIFIVIILNVLFNSITNYNI